MLTLQEQPSGEVSAMMKRPNVLLDSLSASSSAEEVDIFLDMRYYYDTAIKSCIFLAMCKYKCSDHHTIPVLTLAQKKNEMTNK